MTGPVPPGDTMNAIVVEQFGDSEQLVLRRVPRPSPGHGQVLVRVAAAGVNPVDASNRADGTWARLTTPYTPGSDGSGAIVEVGQGGRGFAPGDEVFYFTDFLAASAGSYAEYQVVDADVVASKPPALTHVEAAAIPLAAGTAHDLVVSRLAVGPGDTVLVVGAAGGVGGFVLQLLRNLGATIVAVARNEHTDVLRALGAAIVLDYRDGDVYDRARTKVGEVDHVVDLVGGETVERSIPVVRPGGQVATICRLIGDFDLAIDKNVTLHGVLVHPDGDRLKELAGMLERGVLSVEIRAAMPLGQASDAHRLIEQGHGRGKIVLTIDPPSR